MTFDSPAKLFLAGLVAGAAVASLGFVLFRRVTPAPAQNLQNTGTPSTAAVDCTVKEAKQTVTGDSLGKLLPTGSDVKLLQNYYACNPVARNDIAEYNYPGSSIPIAKVVKGVPGDTFSLQKSGSGWNLLINGEAAKTSEGEPYLLDDRAYRMLILGALRGS